MSGTSIDGIDVAIVDFSKITPQIIDFHTFAYPDKLAKLLHSLCQSSDNEIVNMGFADRAAAHASAQAVTLMLERNDLSTDEITAIGSHGQTIRHHPNNKHGFTLQIGDPNTLAADTGIDVIADFRRKDVSLGGQGAPLAPGFHKAVFVDHHCNRVVLNIGGISNITYLPKDIHQSIVGYDTGPGKTLLDAWCCKHTGQPYDEGGAWGAQAKHDNELLELLLCHPFLQQTPPKSTGREDFNLHWLESQLANFERNISPQCVQSTLVMLTSMSIAQQINNLHKVNEVFVCGGGAKNDFLMESLENQLFDCELRSTEELGITADSVEAVAFAWLAYAHINKINGNIPSVTGASRAAILGGFYPAD
jgi:anhydro-N-acetylmuramic acid kinase